jgi:DNA (cytosine-5)-methyltransferase 1
MVRSAVAEFFAGIGLVRAALEQERLEVVFANDIEPIKFKFYAENFGSQHFVLGDVRDVRGDDVPDIDLATASFPCTDLSLAGWRRGLNGAQSSTFWEFARVMREMGARRPVAIMLENVPSFATSRGGEDLASALAELNGLGYWCDVLELDARRWVPQSRPRVFVVGSLGPVPIAPRSSSDPVHPLWVDRFAGRYPQLLLQALPLTPPLDASLALRDLVERFSPNDERWWGSERATNFQQSLSSHQAARLQSLIDEPHVSYRTAYRRTRHGRPVWEIRPDDVSGCLRAVTGGSSRQALLEAGRGSFRVRWMTAREYARLMGAPRFRLTAGTENQALFGLGDAVCVPAVAWLARHYLLPLASGELFSRQEARALTHA